MHLTPDQVEYWRHGPLVLNQTIVNTWIVMAALAGGSWVVTRRLGDAPTISPWQHGLEVVVLAVRRQIREAGLGPAERYLPFVGTLFLFIEAATLLTVVPGFHAPTASLSTTTALALAVFAAVPIFGTWAGGLRGYLAHFLEPSPVLLPLHVVDELSRTLALAVRLFGNAMSGGLILAILLAVAPLGFPVLMSLLKLLTGSVQAYIFAVLATVYIAAAARVAPGGAREEGSP